jgi:hypothetical protein
MGNAVPKEETNQLNSNQKLNSIHDISQIKVYKGDSFMLNET